MGYNELTENEILTGFREGDSDVIRRYFYDYLEAGYRYFDRKYQLREKENLDFMSLAHQYALYLLERDWKPLEEHSPDVTFRSWLIGGFRYVVLDALKWYKKEYGNITFEDYICTFNVANGLRLQFNKLVEDVCEHWNLSPQERKIIDLILVKGYKGKEVAEMMGLTPSAVSQRYSRLREKLIVPYFRMYFDMDLELAAEEELLHYQIADMAYDASSNQMPMYEMEMPSSKRFAPERRPDEIFVFGSNLKGLHFGADAQTALRSYGAVWGQGVGLQGKSYAIPVMQGGVGTIRPYVDDFISFAKAHPRQTFRVSRIGCDLAGFTDSDIAPLFIPAHGMSNIILPHGWKRR